MNEEQIIWALVHGMFQQTMNHIFDWIHSFYKDYDPRKTLNKDYIVQLICDCKDYLSCIEDCKYYGKKDNC